MLNAKLKNCPKTLILMRHGKAELKDSGSDFDRNLTQNGIDKCHAAADKLRDYNIHIDKILTSPAARTKETANIISQKLQLPHNLLQDVLDFYDCQNINKILEHIKRQTDDINTLMIVGHNPTISQLADYLCPIEEFNINIFRTSTFVIFSCDIKKWNNIKSEVGLVYRYR